MGGRQAFSSGDGTSQEDEGTYARIIFAPSAIENIVRVTNVRIAHMTEPMPFYVSPWADFSLELLSPQVI